MSYYETNKLKSYLEKLGGEEIVKIIAFRRPIPETLSTVLNLFSLGKFKQLSELEGYDKYFHLGVILDFGHRKILLEKNEVVNVENFSGIKPGDEYLVPDMVKSLTFYQLVSETVERIGKYNFFHYDSFNLNCQVFCKELFITTGQWNSDPNLQHFVFQSVADVRDKLPSYIPKAMNLITDIGSRFRKIIGSGKIIKKRTKDT